MGIRPTRSFVKVPTRPLPTMTMRIGRVRIFSEVENIVANELGELLGTSLHQSKKPTAHDLTHTSVISLTLAADHLQIQLGIGVDEPTREHLAEVLLGGDSTVEAICDALREMANTAGGAIRRAAMDDGMCFAMGLPTNDNVFASEKRRRGFAITDANGLYLECVVTVSANRAKRIDVSELREGMVIATDICDETGAIVVAAGSSLTATTAEHIGTLLARGSLVEISTS
jgi:hypothetical protein